MRGVFRISDIDGKRAILVENLVTRGGRDSYIEGITVDTAPQWNYMGIGFGTTAPASADYYLETEIGRYALTSRYGEFSMGAGTAWYGTVHMKAIVPADDIAGNWKEIGIYDIAANRQVLYECDAVGDFTSDGSLSIDSSIRRDGPYALKCNQIMGGEIAFNVAGDTINAVYPQDRIGTAGYLQFWYRTNLLVTNPRVRFGIDSNNYYVLVPVIGPVDTWTYFNQQIGDGTTVGNPGTAVSSWRYFRFKHDNMLQTSIQWLDRISLYMPMGTLMARATIDYTKNIGTPALISYALTMDTDP
jgi:hypothetical protein